MSDRTQNQGWSARSWGRIALRILLLALAALALYFFLSDITTAALGDVGSAMAERGTRFWLIDSMVGCPTLRSCRRVLQGAESAFTICRRNRG